VSSSPHFHACVGLRRPSGEAPTPLVFVCAKSGSTNVVLATSTCWPPEKDACDEDACAKTDCWNCEPCCSSFVSLTPSSPCVDAPRPFSFITECSGRTRRGGFVCSSLLRCSNSTSDVRRSCSSFAFGFLVRRQHCHLDIKGDDAEVKLVQPGETGLMEQEQRGRSMKRVDIH
jgi:hypothetical protein